VAPRRYHRDGVATAQSDACLDQWLAQSLAQLLGQYVGQCLGEYLGECFGRSAAPAGAAAAEQAHCAVEPVGARFDQESSGCRSVTAHIQRPGHSARGSHRRLGPLTAHFSLQLQAASFPALVSTGSLRT